MLRADGSQHIGLGHVVRSMALGRELARLGASVEVWGSAVDQAKSLARSFSDLSTLDFGMPDGSFRQVPKILSFEPDIVVVDGYHFEPAFFKELDTKKIPYCVIDDNGETSAENPRLLINQNPSASAEIYGERFSGATLLLGLSYALLRSEVRELAQSDSQVAQFSEKVFVSLGGSDPRHLTLGICELLVGCGLMVTVAVGPGFNQPEKLRCELASTDGVEVVSGAEALRAMAASSVSVVAAGSTLWEANALRKPVIGLIVADNQAKPARRAQELGLIQFSLDLRDTTDLEAVQEKLCSAVEQARHHPTIMPLAEACGAVQVAKRILAEVV